LRGLSADTGASRPARPRLVANLAAERDAFVRAAPHHLSDDELDNFAIYDAYFQVERATLDAASFADALFETWSVALADIAQALLGRDEMEVLLRALRVMLARIGSVEPDATTGANGKPPILPEDEAERVMVRWRTGHHLFGLCAMHAREAFVDAAAASEPAAIAEALGRATTFARANAAAMWYTSEFPIDFYLNVVRPGMMQSGAHGGFSGTQNADHRRMLWAREQAVEALFVRFGTDAAAWPPDVYTALMNFNEMEIQAAEHHVLVAASKVRLDQSLAQKIVGDRTSAVTVLREKVDAIASDIVERFSSEATRRVRACAVSDVPVEHPLGIRLEGVDIVLARAYGAIWACDGVCPHAGGELADGHMADNAIVCPMHGAKFDPRTGAVTRGPASDPLRTYTVVIDGTDVLVELP
jgi:nitrite reductase/ring-hydroxylating ferredoxin subunit